MGELLSLFSAFAWAIGLLLFRGPLARHAAAEVNLFKCAFAAVLLGLTALLALAVGGAVALDARAALLLALSGVIGISFGDTLLFQSMARLGATRALMLQSTNPLLATLFGWLFLSEALTTLQLLGIATCSGGTLLVIARGGSADVQRARVDALGVVLGLGAAAGQAAGMLLVREALLGSDGGTAGGSAQAISAAALRVTAGGAALLLPALWRSPRGTAELLGSRASWSTMGPASFIGTYLGILSMTLALDLAATGVVSALTSTTPLFLLGIGVVWLRERHGILSYGGVALGVLGAILLVI